MTIFHCQGCGNTLFFENVWCVKCGRKAGYLSDKKQVATLDPAGDGRFHPVNEPAYLYRACGNDTAHGICNWMIEDADDNSFCRACRLNDTIPDLSLPGNKERWQKIEQAKRRVLLALRRLGLAVKDSPPQGKHPLQFRFLGAAPGAPPPLTGHAKGVITINIAEADDDERERRRVALKEPYRTLVGHLRHELAHYFWDVLVMDTSRLEGYRALFGDETSDYQAALQTHYQQAGDPAQWTDNFVSSYAASHPWEDWAETWAHYLHLRDTLETAASVGIQFAPGQGIASAAEPPAQDGSFESLLAQWLPLTCALNEVNRSMGLPDLYPFVLSNPAIAKLKFVHDVIAEEAASANGNPTAASPSLPVSSGQFQ